MNQQTHGLSPGRRSALAKGHVTCCPGQAWRLHLNGIGGAVPGMEGRCTRHLAPVDGGPLPLSRKPQEAEDKASLQPGPLRLSFSAVHTDQ